MLESCPFLPDCHICWHIVVHSAVGLLIHCAPAGTPKYLLHICDGDLWSVTTHVTLVIFLTLFSCQTLFSDFLFFTLIFPFYHHTYNVWNFIGYGLKQSCSCLSCDTAPAMLGPSHICNLCLNLQHLWIYNPLSEVSDQTCILMDTMSCYKPIEPHWELLIFLFYLF